MIKDVYSPDYNFKNNFGGDKWLSSRIDNVDDKKGSATWIIYKYINGACKREVLNCDTFSYSEIMNKLKEKCTTE